MKQNLQTITANGRLFVNLLFPALYLTCMLTSCQHTSYRPANDSATAYCAEKETADWKKEVGEKLPLLGHRNWIVVTDMAYPLQTGTGVTTLYTDTPYQEVLAFVMQTLREVPHVYPHIYRDAEFNRLRENFCPGIDSIRAATGALLPAGQVTYRDHESLIATLDSVSRLFQVLILKTNLTIPYSSVFFELDCKYWNAAQQEALEKETGR